MNPVRSAAPAEERPEESPDESPATSAAPAEECPEESPDLRSRRPRRRRTSTQESSEAEKCPVQPSANTANRPEKATTSAEKCPVQPSDESPATSAYTEAKECSEESACAAASAHAAASATSPLQVSWRQRARSSSIWQIELVKVMCSEHVPSSTMQANSGFGKPANCQSGRLLSSRHAPSCASQLRIACAPSRLRVASRGCAASAEQKGEWRAGRSRRDARS